MGDTEPQSREEISEIRNQYTKDNKFYTEPIEVNEECIHYPIVLNIQCWQHFITIYSFNFIISKTCKKISLKIYTYLFYALVTNYGSDRRVM
jgi:hypothetical protein